MMGTSGGGVSVTAGCDDRESISSSSSPSIASALPTGRSGDTMDVIVDRLRVRWIEWAQPWQSRIRFDTLRPVPVFLGVDPATGYYFATGAFSPPIKKVDKSSIEKISSRVKLNVAFFCSNYALVATMTALVVALMHPGMILTMAAIYGLWMLHFWMVRQQQLQQELYIFGVALQAVVTLRQRLYLLLAFTAWAIIWKCLVPTFIFVLISSILILSHALLRDPKHVEASSHFLNDRSAIFHADNDNHDDEEEGGASGDLSGESAVLVERPSSSARSRGGGRGDVI